MDLAAKTLGITMKTITTARWEGFYELQYEIKSGIYVVEEISQVEFLRKVVESKGHSELDSADWWVTGKKKPHEIIFRSRWSQLKADSRLYSALPIIPIFLNTQFSKEVASVAFLILVTVDLFLPLTSALLNCLRYTVKTRLQILISLISRCKTRQVIFDVLTGFRPGMKPCLDRIHKVVRLDQINIIVFPKENPLCYPFNFEGSCFLPSKDLEGGIGPESTTNSNNHTTVRFWSMQLEDKSTIKYWRVDPNPEKGPAADNQSPSLEGCKDSDSIPLQANKSDKLETTAGEDDVDGSANHDDPTADGYSHLAGDDEKESSNMENHVVHVQNGAEISRNDGSLNGNSENELEPQEITIEVYNYENTLVWQSRTIKYTRGQRKVLEYYLRHMEKTFSVEACTSRYWGKEFCVQPKSLFDTLDDIRSNPQCRLVRARGNFLVGPSIANRSRLFRL
ncbi:hypothetical protein Mapa_010734 [Marchantia paleacea]|nr:hypothetical protein Mapa_010734 [Marchantia paleacea]